jgi:hypothetical protein
MNRSFLGRATGLMAAVAILTPSCAWASPSSDRKPAGGTIAAIPLDAAVSSGGLYMMQAHAEMLRPAPLPDRDVSAPGRDAVAAQADSSLAPGFFNPQSHFQGDGFAPGSSIEGDHNHRHSTGGGMNLSIPMP